MATANLCFRINNHHHHKQQPKKYGFNFSVTKLVVMMIIFCCIITKAESSRCHAKCSPHFTLPCSFGAFDKCIETTCKDACQKDGNRKMIGCFCRGTIEGPTMRACFCSPSPTHKSMVMI